MQWLSPGLFIARSALGRSRYSSSIKLRKCGFSPYDALRQNQCPAGCPALAATERIRLFSSSNAARKDRTYQTALHEFPPERIRNFCIVAHIDHGKSTLADRLLELTGTLTGDASTNQQTLDKLQVERERGITVKAVSASMVYKAADSKEYLLNLLDTPGHVDFSYEVSRSLLACQGALLLVDASQGIQAQTLSVLDAAKAKGLTAIIGVMNKIDLPNASPEEVKSEVELLLGADGGPGGSILSISAKTGLGCSAVLQRIVDKIAPPEGNADEPLRALVFDNYYDNHRGVVSLVAIIDGVLKKGDRVTFKKSGKTFEIQTVGMLHPDEQVTPSLQAGQVGFVVCGMKSHEDAFLGDTVHKEGRPVDDLASFEGASTNVVAGFYPQESIDFPKLDEALQKLVLTDRSVSLARETSAALGQGFRLGFYGALHLEVFKQRLFDEYGSEVIVTKPFVPLKMLLKDDTEISISSPVDFPSHEQYSLLHKVEAFKEPMIEATIIAPDEYAGGIMQLCSDARGQQVSLDYLESSLPGLASSQRAKFVFLLPLSSIITSFYSDLKSISSGFASMDYKSAGYLASDLVKLSILVNGKSVDALCTVVHRSAAEREGRVLLTRLKDVMSRQQFEVVLQAAVGSKILARERIAPYRKDVTAGLYGGHYERKLKHLKKQQAGKKRLKRIGNVEIDISAFSSVLSSDTTSKNKRKS